MNEQKDFFLKKKLFSEAELQEFNDLVKNLSYHDNLYYSLGFPEITDAEYDELKKRYEELSEKKANVENNEFSFKVGSAKILNVSKIVHSIPMLSLKNSFSEKDLEAFIKSIDRFLKFSLEKIDFIAEPKIDGLSLSLKYVERKLVYAITRGNGKIGEDVTENAKLIKDIPHILPKEAPSILEIRGEVYMEREEFFRLNEFRSEKNEKLFTTPRNAAAGSLRQLNSEITKSRKLNFFVYSLGEAKEKIADTQFQMFEKLKKFGFSVNPLIEICESLEEMLHYFSKIDKMRMNLPYDIDGVVYKVNSLDLQKRLGNTSNAPRWAIAQKFSAQTASTILEKIEIQVGRTGSLTPVAHLRPINVGGVLISKATLHNENYIQGLDNQGKPLKDRGDIRVGDTVTVKRAGDVIPQIIDVDLESRLPSAKKFIYPTTCPICHSPAVKEKGEAVRRCTGDIICSAQAVEYLKHFVSRNGFDIEGLGKQRIDFFYAREEDSLKIKRPDDIFTLEKRQKNSSIKLENIDGFGVLSVENLYKSINEQRKISFSRFLSALGIRHIGVVTAENIAKYYKKYSYFHENMIEIQNSSTQLQKDYEENEIWQELTNIENVGTITGKAVFEFYNKNYNLEMIKNLCQEIEILDYQNETVINTPLTGKKIIFTGTLQSMSREEAKAAAQKMGAQISSSLTKNTDFLIYGSKAGSKLAKAQALNISVLTEDEWLNYVRKSSI